MIPLLEFSMKNNMKKAKRVSIYNSFYDVYKLLPFIVSQKYYEAIMKMNTYSSFKYH